MPNTLRMIQGPEGLIGLTTTDLLEDAWNSQFDEHRVSGGGPVVILGEFEFTPQLVPEHRRSDGLLRGLIRGIVESLGPVSSRVDLTAVEAGLFLMHGCLDESHTCSQSIEGKGVHANGDYWHAIMHRQEPDYGNSKYWFRRVRRHPVFRKLPKHAESVISRREMNEFDVLTRADWDPIRFVDLCERCAQDEESPEALTLREIQGWEMSLLLEQSITDAIG